MDGTECCGKCRWHRKEPDSPDWICTNPMGQFDSVWTDYGFICEDFEDRPSRISVY